MAVPEPQSLTKNIMNGVEQSDDNDAKAASDILGLEDIECILKENAYGLGSQNSLESLGLNPRLSNCIWSAMQATLLMRERFGRFNMNAFTNGLNRIRSDLVRFPVLRPRGAYVIRL